MKIRIYLDGPVPITNFKEFHSKCEFFTTPYDDPSARRKKISKLAPISNARWEDINWNWGEWTTPWKERGSEHFNILEKIVGKNNRKDILHLDSAYKAKVEVFLTSDKGNICKHRPELEGLLKFKIFHMPSEVEALKLILSS